MKRIVAYLLSIVLMFSFYNLNVLAAKDDDSPYIVEFKLTSDIDENLVNEETRASGLILAYDLTLTKTGSKLNICGFTKGSIYVVKSGFKDLMVQRRKTSSDPWKDYFDIGDVYADTVAANLDMTVSVTANYQYRITCKHYAKKSLLSVETISNISNIVTTS